MGEGCNQLQAISSFSALHFTLDIILLSDIQPSEPKIKPSRMLLLEITDGTQTVFGMEYQLIPFLKVTTPPGTKVGLSCSIIV